MNYIKKMGLLLATAVVFAGCGVNRQAQQVKTLEKCRYRLVSAENVRVAGADVSSLIRGEQLNIGSLPGLALGLLRKNVPLDARLNLEVSNPTGNTAAINRFEYKIQVNRQDLAEGMVNNGFSIAPGQTMVVPVNLTSNVYNLVANADVADRVIKALRKKSKDNEVLGLLTIKIKPTIMLGNTAVTYPGYITIDKEISSQILL
ncbi:LEA type 2 family protein [Pedobacter sp. SYP-B3415]|uniref:LEA type 2 family protein n=1 Tax=Pedobacter sp. SYP-B3415 TaxID=2496641 RepID=UPI0013EC709B|nr:LEA type 2 family protein [Pedobacter sp. SYP-B3415]